VVRKAWDDDPGVAGHRWKIAEIEHKGSVYRVAVFQILRDVGEGDVRRRGWLRDISDGIVTLFEGFTELLASGRV
jgi:hypothetical protein